ncbi:tyrosine-type recombinase/integrase [Mesorhizobium caraganae]|uniref:tyrosine-type recombinase/integrase n=1 Tax=Mesorhizobium caraganae TaxID=483206 RepID=UPI00177C6241|nr:site-specific integrase [Mesorhizobium caraganae]
MAKRLRDTNLDSKAAREKLKARGDPYYRNIDRGVHLGYRKGTRGAAWVMRTYDGRNYLVRSIGQPDDLLDADGANVLTFWQAVDKARSLIAQRVDQPKPAYTVGAALDDYLTHAKERQKSFRDTQITVETMIRPTFGAIEIAKLTKRDISDWHNKLAATPRRLRTKKGKEQKYATGEMSDVVKRQRKSTANRVLTVLKAALNLAFRDEHVTDDKAWRRVESFEDVDTARIRYLSVAEAQRLINASATDFRKLVQAALQTGCRYGELCRLRVNDFNAAAETLAIYVSKTGQPRHINLTDEGVEFFRSLTVGREGAALMLTKADGSAWRESHQSRPMVEACKQAKISPPVKFHELRHTWASLSVMNEMPLMVVAKNLGHVDTRMVEKHYGHLAPSYVRDAIKAGAPRFALVGETNVQAIG